MKPVIGAPIALCLGVLLACGSSDAGSSGGSLNGPTEPPSPPPTASVSAFDFQFSPSPTQISVGGQVTWTNNGPSIHTVTSDSGQWDSGLISAQGSGGDPYSGGGSAGGSYIRTFSQAGTFTYHCSIHANMKGTITVTE
jgi:plastocyanin